MRCICPDAVVEQRNSLLCGIDPGSLVWKAATLTTAPQTQLVTANNADLDTHTRDASEYWKKILKIYARSDNPKEDGGFGAPFENILGF